MISFKKVERDPRCSHYRSCVLHVSFFIVIIMTSATIPIDGTPLPPAPNVSSPRPLMADCSRT